jgi:hypothetical protein
MLKAVAEAGVPRAATMQSAKRDEEKPRNQNEKPRG